MILLLVMVRMAGEKMVRLSQVSWIGKSDGMA
jgi:hypothetical protein